MRTQCPTYSTGLDWSLMGTSLQYKYAWGHETHAHVPQPNRSSLCLWQKSNFHKPLHFGDTLIPWYVCYNRNRIGFFFFWRSHDLLNNSLQIDLNLGFARLTVNLTIGAARGNWTNHHSRVSSSLQNTNLNWNSIFILSIINFSKLTPTYSCFWLGWRALISSRVCLVFTDFL